MIYSFVPLLCGCDYTQAARLLCLFITTSSRDSHHHRAAALRLRPRLSASQRHRQRAISTEIKPTTRNLHARIDSRW